MYAVKRMPSAPRILASLGRLLLDMTSGIADFTHLLKQDAALTARIIRISNSAIYNLGTPFASLEDALARVGFTEVYRLTGFAAVAQIADQQLPLYGINGTQLRENSLFVALMMEKLASFQSTDARAAYTAGLLRSIGKLALDGLTRDSAYNATYTPQRGPLANWETGVTGLNNCEAAALVLTEWRFNPDTIGAIEGHYFPGEKSSTLTHMLNLAAAASERYGLGLPGETVYWQNSLERLGGANVDEAQFETAARRAIELFGAMRAAVG